MINGKKKVNIKALVFLCNLVLLITIVGCSYSGKLPEDKKDDDGGGTSSGTITVNLSENATIKDCNVWFAVYNSNGLDSNDPPNPTGSMLGIGYTSITSAGRGNGNVCSTSSFGTELTFSAGTYYLRAIADMLKQTPIGSPAMTIHSNDYYTDMIPFSVDGHTTVSIDGRFIHQDH